MSGKKKEKFRISIGLACNADGSERLEPFVSARQRNPDASRSRHQNSGDFIIGIIRRLG
jgi:hypothetical protein